MLRVSLKHRLIFYYKGKKKNLLDFGLKMTWTYQQEFLPIYKTFDILDPEKVLF